MYKRKSKEYCWFTYRDVYANLFAYTELDERLRRSNLIEDNNFVKKPDYSKIAPNYDKNKARQKIEPDRILKEYLESKHLNEYNILDLGCGTGNYLRVQVSYFKEKGINWHGMDLSKEMLEIAKAKVSNVKYAIGNVDQLPYESQSFDFITNNFAFHHFENKDSALNEINRVLKYDGIFKMTNISPFQMKKWWIYQYFPSAYEEDLDRFWKPELIYYELKNRDFDVKIDAEYELREIELRKLIEEAERRDISELSIISEEEYKKGLDKMRADSESKENLRILSEFGLLMCIAKKHRIKV